MIKKSNVIAYPRSMSGALLKPRHKRRIAQGKRALLRLDSPCRSTVVKRSVAEHVGRWCTQPI
jgi:hypothetical protein